MKCPQCQDGMRKGYIWSGYAMDWIPEGSNRKIWYSQDRSEGFRNTKPNIFGNSQATAYYCGTCEFILIDAKRKKE